MYLVQRVRIPGVQIMSRTHWAVTTRKVNLQNEKWDILCISISESRTWELLCISAFMQRASKHLDKRRNLNGVYNESFCRKDQEFAWLRIILLPTKFVTKQCSFRVHGCTSFGTVTPSVFNAAQCCVVQMSTQYLASVRNFMYRSRNHKWHLLPIVLLKTLNTGTRHLNRGRFRKKVKYQKTQRMCDSYVVYT